MKYVLELHIDGASISPLTESDVIQTASPSPSPSPRVFTDDDVQPGPTPLLMIIALLAVSWLLVRSMRRHLKKVPADLDVPSRRSES